MSDPRPPAEHTLLGTDDAMVWATEFCRIFNGKLVVADEFNHTNPGPVDPGTMVSWFANAMQVAINHAEKRWLHARGELTQTEQFLKTWEEEHPDPEDDSGHSDNPDDELEDAVTLEEQFLEGFQEGRPPT
jgi:hypothetical protein